MLSLVPPIPAPAALLAETLGPARRGLKEKGVHQLRVATRRVDVWLRLAGYHVLRDDLRWIRGVAGAARDLDVLLGLEWPDEVRERLRRERKLARSTLADALAGPRPDAIVAALAVLPAIPAPAAARATRGLVRGLLTLVVDPTVPAEVHQRRRRLRRIRYAYELLGSRLDPLIALQDVLGRVSDLWIRRQHVPHSVPDALLAEGLAEAEAAWQRERPTLESLA